MQCCWSWWELGDSKRTDQATCLSFPLHKSQFLTGTMEQKNKLALQHYLSVPVAVFYFLILFVVAYEYRTCTWYCIWSKNLMIATYFLSHVWSCVHGYYVLLHPWLSVVWCYSTMPKRSTNYSMLWNPTTVPKCMNIHGPSVCLSSTVICQCISVYFIGLSQEKVRDDLSCHCFRKGSIELFPLTVRTKSSICPLMTCCVISLWSTCFLFLFLTVFT